MDISRAIDLFRSIDITVLDRIIDSYELSPDGPKPQQVRNIRDILGPIGEVLDAYETIEGFVDEGIEYPDDIVGAVETAVDRPDTSDAESHLDDARTELENALYSMREALDALG